MPKRIQRKRTKGWRMPEGAVYVGRPTAWGNRFRIDEGFSRESVIREYREFLNSDWAIIATIQARLRGKDLTCWCPLDQPCHADVLLEIANREEEREGKK